jgi:hypothetical protein
VSVEATYDAKHASVDAHVQSYEAHAEAEAHHAACLTLLAIIEKDTP